MTTEAEFLSAYERIKSSYKAIMEQVDVAVAYEEQEQPAEAMATYARCIELIEAAFALPVGLPEDIDAVSTQWTDACQLIQKLKSAKTEMTYRLKVLRARHAPVDMAAVEAAEGGELGELPPKHSPLLDNPYTQYDIHTATGTPKTYRDIIGGLRELMATPDTGVLFDTLFQAQVKLYKIQSDGVVAAIAGNTSMSLVMCSVQGQWSYLNGICFIQGAMEETPGPSSAGGSINNLIWLYPLIPAVTVCYRTEYGAIILPDLESDVAGTAFGIMLVASNEGAAAAAEADDEVMHDKQQFLLDLLEAVLAGAVEELKQPTRREAGSQQVSRHIVCAADFIARQLVWSAERTGELMVKSTPYIMARMQPAGADAPPVSSKLQTSVEVARSVTGAAVGVTGWVAGKVGAASLAVGRFLAPHIQTQGANLLQKGFGYDCTEANDKMEGAMTIAAGAVEGFTTVYNGLETSAKILGTNLSENSVKIIEHKYGPSAGNVAAGTFDTLGNAFNVSQNVNYMTPKGIAKKMAKNTGKAVVDDYQRTLRSADGHVVPAGLLYPDLRSLKDKEHSN